MEKKSIFKKIDALYTKVTKVIIGDMPLDNEDPSSTKGAQKNNPTSIKEKKESLQKTFGLAKEKFFNLGKTQDEKSLLYKEVVKREEVEKKELEQTHKVQKKAIEATKKEVNVNAVAKPSVKSPTTKKTPDKKKTTKPTIKKKSTQKPTPPTTSNKKSPKVEDVVDKTKVSSAKKKKADTKDTASTKKTTGTKPSSEKKPTPKSKPLKETTTKKSKTDTKDKTKTTVTKKTTAAPRGAKKAEKIALYIQDIKKHYGEVDEDFVAIIVKNLGPSIYKTDAELVSCSDPKELDTVRQNFLKKKLGIDASQAVLDAAIQDVCTELKGVRRKYRATFYYALAKKFKKESVLS